MERKYAELEDNDLAQLAHEDHDAFEVLYYRYVTPIYRYCYARTDNVADAEDLTAQTFLAMLESIHRLRGQHNFPAWLFGIARHKCADHYRQAYAMRQEPLGEVEPADPDLENTEERLFRDSILECVEHLLAQLSPDRLEALHLRYWGGLSTREAAKVMQRSEAALKMLISRAISDLRERCVTS
ncbi:MAG TPA: RNA polymerase sigma factor [Anaerolineae bacterium]|nr:RNA polymerase sigma factor [Anaerolineae bacterium]HQH39889.1 RNA polymerase sigma factor [Anaerolineae bacterium]